MPHSPQDIHKKVLGKNGEDLVVKYLKKKKCKILKRNYRTPFGEADIIAQDGDEIAFVEVKTRFSKDYGLPSEAVGADKQRRYRQIAKCYALERGVEPNARFDVAEVYEGGRVEYFKHAFM